MALSHVRRYLAAGYSLVSHRLSNRKMEQEKALIASNKLRLQEAGARFTAYPDVLFVFQTFNKATLLPDVLDPFVKLSVQKVILFADGCCDATQEIAHAMLPGKEHFVVACNDTYETRNYRTALAIAVSLRAKYVLLMQDDDLYGHELQGWLDHARVAMEADVRLAIIGGNDGFNLGKCPSNIDEGLTTANFSTFQDERGEGYRLGDYEEMVFARPKYRSAGWRQEYVAWVNRAPQMIRVSHACEARFFPPELEPYQYDDHFNSLAAWMRGFRVLHLPLDDKIENIGVGGMRAHNGVTVNMRPAHFVKNWQWVLKQFERPWADGAITEAVAEANDELATRDRG